MLYFLAGIDALCPMPNMHTKVLEYDQKVYEYSHCVLTVPMFEYDFAAATDICLSIIRPP